MLILVKKQVGRVHMFPDLYFGSSQIHQLTMMYRFVIHLKFQNFISKSGQTFIACA